MDGGQPRKKIVWLVLACLIGVSAVGFAVYANKKNGSNSGEGGAGDNRNSQAIEIVQKKLADKAAEDSDKDGLVNWEETLWGSDPAVADSDKDGTSDGEEVKLGRNPIKPGPNDVFTGASIDEKIKAITAVDQDKTLTGQVSRDFFATYIQAKQSGVALDAETQTKIIEQTFINRNFSVPVKEYTITDLNIGQDNLREYGNDLGKAFQTGLAKDPETEIQILQAALASSLESDLARLDPIIAGYKSIIANAAKVKTPKEMAATHVALLNGLSHVLSDIEGFRKILSDPLVGLGGVTNYYQDVDAMQKAIFDITAMFAQRNVTFKQDEYGYVLVHTI